MGALKLMERQLTDKEKELVEVRCEAVVSGCRVSVSIEGRRGVHGLVEHSTLGKERCVCVCACVRACVRACVCACVCVCVSCYSVAGVGRS